MRVRERKRKGENVVNKAYKFRIYPNKKQRNFFAKIFGCVRFIYNKMLSDKIAYYHEHKKMLKNTPAQYKKEYPWLNEADSLALANAQQNLNCAFKNFFTNPAAGFPKYKSKKTIEVLTQQIIKKGQSRLRMER